MKFIFALIFVLCIVNVAEARKKKFLPSNLGNVAPVAPPSYPKY
jgi:hypothetical protein